MRPLLRAAAIPVLAALGATTSITPAEAATGSLTITAIDRSGHPTTAYGYFTNSPYRQWFRPGKSRRLPNGHYGVSIVIAPQGTTYGATQTVGARSFTIKNNHVSLTFDARKGRRFSVTPSVPRPPYFSYEADICIGGSDAGGIAHWVGVDDYAIPTADKDVRLGVTSEWAMSPSGPFYWAIGQGAGIPTNPTYSFAHTSFAKLEIKVLKGKVKNPQTSLLVNVATHTCSSGAVSWASFNAPRTVTAYLTAGTWQPFIIYNDNHGYTPGSYHYFRANSTYHLTLNRTP